ncbi:MAG: hypothetical protein C5B50_03965 [Verrucomicrobia bacterium]|nr:MAG: hypothetical protein C5B50_03965 [Verrucomicrobiota bacterium]
MSTAILGLSAFYHDSAAALVVDGDIVAAAQEERFSRKKHDERFPAHATDNCLREAGLKIEDLNYIAFYDKPLVKFDRLLESYVSFAPAGFRSFRLALPIWVKEKLHLRRFLRKQFRQARKAPIIFTEHHESHAASAFFPSPFDETAILTVDGVGEWSTAAMGKGQGNKFELLRQLEFPHSLGLLYSAFTYYCGFKVNSGEYKLMGLAPYGKPVWQDLILKEIAELKPDGSLWMNMDYLNYCQGLTMTNERFHRLFGGPPRRPEAMLEQRHMDLAASIQRVTEEALLRMGRETHRLTGSRNLVLAGGVALNCVADGRLWREGPFEGIWVQPAAGDAGGALGAALFVWHQLLDKPRGQKAALKGSGFRVQEQAGAALCASGGDSQKGSFLGPRFSNEEISRLLTEMKLPFEKFEHEAPLLERTAKEIADGKIIGWFQGRMEFGPRALGARSILGDPRNVQMQAAMNLKIKFRESFRPFAPAVLLERAQDYFELATGQESPYMLHVAPVLERHRLKLTAEQEQIMKEDPDLRHRVNVPRSTLPAITHLDYSARLQTVDERRHGRFYRLLRAFEALTGCPVLVNTSFNVRGEPIVCTPQEACRCFLATDMDLLVIEDFVVSKEGFDPQLLAREREKYLAQFQLD